ncbi:unnamed protein product, partial [marine sediment metagenome]
MTPRERVYATLGFGGPDRIARDLWGERRVGKLFSQEWSRVVERFPMDFDRSPSILGSSSRADGDCSRPGTYTDDWGSVWETLKGGVAGEVICPALDDWKKLASFEPPHEMIENPALDTVESFCHSTDTFRLGEVGPGPFERLQFLRGATNLYLDLGEQPRELAGLIDMLHRFYLAHVDLWC